jgi:hypothetical protein
MTCAPTRTTSLRTPAVNAARSPFRNALDFPLAHFDQIIRFVDAEDEFSGEEAADDGLYAILIDVARPVLDPFEIKALAG